MNKVGAPIFSCKQILPLLRKRANGAVQVVVMLMISAVLALAVNGLRVVPVSASGHPAADPFQPQTHSFAPTSSRLLQGPLTVYVGDDYGSGTPGWGVDHFATIQDGINAVEANGEVIVAAGEYIESVLISKPLSLKGPQFGIDPRPTGTTPRSGGEAILRPPTLQPSENNLITVTADNVTIDGFYLDGNNPTLGAVGEQSNGVYLHIAGGVANGTENPLNNWQNPISNLTVSNNIFTNFNIYGVMLASDLATPKGDNLITQNVFDNMAGGDTPYGSRRGVSLRNNQYASVMNNKFTRVRVGIACSIYSASNPGAAAVISGNAISSVRDGIWLQQFTQNTSPFTISNNTLDTEAGSTINVGVRLYTIKDSSNVLVQNNTINSGALNGVQLWNISTTSDIRIQGGSIGAALDSGVLFVNVRPGTGVPASGYAARLTVDHVAISGGPVGIQVVDSLANTLTQTLQITVTNDTSVIGAGTGILVSGSDATATIANNDNSFASNSLVGVDIANGGRVSLTGNAISNNGIGVRIDGGGSLTQARNNFITGNTGDGIQLISGTVGNVENNDLSANGGLGFNNATGSLVNASANWWGSNTTVGVSAEVSSNVDFTPWFSSGSDSSASPGFQGNYAALWVDDDSPQSGSQGRIIEGIGLVTAGGALNVQPGIYAESVTLNKNTVMTLSGPLTLNGSLNIQQGTVIAPNTTFSLSGNFMRSGGVFNHNSGELLLNGAAAQTIGGSLATTFYNLTLSNGNGVSLGNSIQVNNTLSLNNTRLVLSTNNLTLGQNATVSGSFDANNMIVADDGGLVCKQFASAGSFLFPIGDDSGVVSYTPGTLQFTSGVFSSGQACMGVIDARHPNNNSQNYLSRYWKTNTSGISNFSANLTFNYATDAEDVVGEENYIYAMRLQSGAPPEIGAAVDSVNNQFSMTVAALTDFSGGNLPPSVTVSSFTVSLELLSARLRWTTSQEENFQGFNILRSSTIDGPRQQLNSTIIAPHGTGIVYEFLDSTVQPGQSYYWLQILGYEGRVTFEGPLSFFFTALRLPIILR